MPILLPLYFHQMRTHIHTCMPAHTHVHTHLHMHTHACPHIHMCIPTCTHTHACPHTHAHTYTHACPQTYIHTCLHTHVPAHMRETALCGEALLPTGGFLTRERHTERVVCVSATPGPRAAGPGSDSVPFTPLSVHSIRSMPF